MKYTKFEDKLPTINENKPYKKKRLGVLRTTRDIFKNLDKDDKKARRNICIAIGFCVLILLV